MQKKIIALAIAGLSSAAFAQSNVTVSGLFDMGYFSSTFQRSTLMDAKSYAASNGSATSNITFAGSEDLGGGMKAGFVFANDLAGTNNTSAGQLWGAGQAYVELAGAKWGSLKLGNVNTASLVASSTSQPFGTGIGSAYSGGFARLSRTTSNGVWAAVVGEGEVAASGASGARLIRLNNSAMYSSPNWSGFSLSLQMAKQNDDTTATAGHTIGFTEVAASYNNGPLNATYVNSTSKTGGTAVAPLGISEKVTHNLLAANYTFGPATVYGGWTSSKSSVAATADSRSWNLALKYAFSGALSAQANIVKVDDKLTTNQDRSLTGLGLDYAMSKRTTAYGRYETGDNDKTDGANGKFTRYQIGLRHSF
jgi:predicted porin